MNTDEMIVQAKQEPCLFPDENVITSQYVAEESVYRFLFGLWMEERTGLSRLDHRLGDYGFIPANKETTDYYQRVDQMGLDFLYLRGSARIDRLSEEDRLLLRSVTKDQDPTYQLEDKEKELIARTYKTVMCVEPQKPSQWFEPTRTIHGDYRVTGMTILVGMRSIPDLDENGELVSEDKELQRLKTFRNIKYQLEEILTRTLEVKVAVFTELFGV